jgi:hypothetical protein
VQTAGENATKAAGENLTAGQGERESLVWVKEKSLPRERGTMLHSFYILQTETLAETCETPQ